MSQFIEMFKNIPSVKIADCCITVSGGTPNTKKIEYYDGGDIPWLSSGEINQGYIFSTDKYITQLGLENSSAKWVPANSVVIAMYGATAGKVGFIKIPLTTNQAVCTLLPNDGFEPLYLYYATLSKTSWMISQCRGAAQPNISQSIIRSMEIPMATIDEQKRFCKLLTQADKSKFGDFKSQFIEMFSKYPSETPWHKLLTIINGKVYPEEYNDIGTYPICGSAGVMYYGEKKLCDANTIILGRKGNINRPIYMESDYWIVDTAFCLDVNKSILHPKYFYYWCCQYDFTKLNKQGVLPSLTRKDLEKIEMSVPPMAEQKKFVSIAEQADKSKFGDFKSQFIEMFGNPLSLNQKNELKRLGECCILNPRRPNIALCDTDKVSFIPMPAVSEDGYLVDMTDEEYGKVKKGFTYFENNDVLFAKITPCMENGKGAIVHGLTNGIGMGSTEFHVLRPINGISSPYWLLALTRMPIFRERAAKNMSGTGGQKRVSASYLDHFMVGLPAIEEQRRFEAIYKQADKSKFELKQCIENIDKVIKSLING